MKHLITILLLALSGLATQAAGVRTLDLESLDFTPKEVSTAPQIKIQNFGDTTIIELNFRYVSVIPTVNGTTEIQISGFQNNLTSHEFRWPVNNTRYSLKNFNNFSFDIIEHEYAEIPMKLSPTPEELPATQDIDMVIQSAADDSNNNLEKGPSDCYLPENVVTPSVCQTYRGQSFLPVAITPVQYNEKESSVRISRRIVYRIIENSRVPQLKLSADSHPIEMQIFDDDTFLRDFVFDTKPDNSKTKLTGEIIPQPSKPAYLIITMRKYLTVVEKFAAWKRLLGYDVTVRYKTGKTHDEWTESTIKNVISSYAQYNPNFYYLMFIGNHEDVPGVEYPHFNKNYGNFVSDFPYACLDGESDLTPDVYFGRVPANNLDEVSNALSKFMDYEQNPQMDEDFYKNAMHIAEFESIVRNGLPIGEEKLMFVYSSETAKKSIESKYNINIRRIYATDENVWPYYYSSIYFNDSIKYPIPTEIVKPYFKWNSKCEDIVEFINTGCLYGLYCYHGYTSGWGKLIPFTSTDVKTKLNNHRKYPLIFSIACSTGAYNKDFNCIAKEFLVANKSGAIGVFAASETSYAPIDDVLSGAMLRCIWPKSKVNIYPGSKIKLIGELDSIYDKYYRVPKNKLGQILNFSTYMLTNTYGEQHVKCLLIKRLYHCFGDPSLEFLTEKPSIVRDVRIIKCSDGFEIMGSASNYKNGAFVSVVDTVYKTIVAFEGLRYCKIAYDYPERCKICVSGPGLKPLIVNGVDGYDGGRVSPRPAIPTTEIYTAYADIATGQKVYGDNPSSEEFTITAIDDKSYRVNINWVRIESYDFMKGYEWWRITKGRDNEGEYGDPLLPALNLTLLKSENPELNKLYADNVEYTDFPNSTCTPMFYLPGSEYDEAEFDPIFPYDGFKPTTIVGMPYAKDKKTLSFEIYPVAYDLNNNTMRVYHSFTLHRGEPSSVRLTQLDNATDVYYTIDGRVEPSPVKGRVYIRSHGGRYEKVIF